MHNQEHESSKHTNRLICVRGCTCRCHKHGTDCPYCNVGYNELKELRSRSASVVKAQNVTLDEKEIRKILWLGHGHTGLYGDDGEMQCNTAGCMLDFKRAPLHMLLDVVLALIPSAPSKT